MLSNAVIDPIKTTTKLLTLKKVLGWLKLLEAYTIASTEKARLINAITLAEETIGNESTKVLVRASADKVPLLINTCSHFSWIYKAGIKKAIAINS
jgi:hypothetical protein